MNQLNKYLSEKKPVDMEDFLIACLHAWYHVSLEDNQYGFRLRPKQSRMTYYANKYPKFPYEDLGLDEQAIYEYTDNFDKMTALVKREIAQHPEMLD